MLNAWLRHSLRIVAMIRYAGISIAAALLAGCGGSQPPIGAAGTMPQTSALTTHADRGTSWMLPEAKSEDLLYISNVYTVTVYSYPASRHVGTLKGFYRTAGECVDTNGDVFIASSKALVEYAHGGKKPIHDITLSEYTPEGCGVDPKSGDLAVTWYQSQSSPNYVAIYPSPTATPKLYTISDVSFVFCGYDARGNLFADGFYGEASSDFVLAELSKGARTLKPLSVAQPFEHPGSVQWDSKYLAVGDDEAQKVYRFSIEGSSASLKATVNLGSAQTVYQTWIEGMKIVGSNGVPPSSTFYWDYPAGGSPSKTLSLKGVQAPYGAVISKAPK